MDANNWLTIIWNSIGRLRAKLWFTLADDHQAQTSFFFDYDRHARLE